jgi:hypothetical protein
MIRGGSVAGALGLHEVDTAAHREPTTSQVDIPPVKGAASQRRMPVAGSRRKPRAITLGCRTKPRSPIVWLPASPLPAPRGLATASRRPLGVNGGGSLIADDAVQPPAELRPEPQRRRPGAGSRHRRDGRRAGRQATTRDMRPADAAASHWTGESGGGI